VKTLNQIAEALEKPTAVAIRAALLTWRNSVSQEALTAAITRSGYGIVRSLYLPSTLRDALNKFLPQEIEKAVLAGAKYAAANTRMVKSSSLATMGISFDMSNPEAVSFLNYYNYELVTGITSSSMNGLEEALRAVFVADFTITGAGPYGQAVEIRNLIGLLPSQVTAIENYRDALSGDYPSSSALRNQLRDRRYDGTVGRARRLGEPLSEDRINAMVGRYAERQLSYRALNIARTETLRASNAGQQQLWRRAVKSGVLNPSTHGKVWMTAQDERVCPVCAPLDGTLVDLEGQFSSDVEAADGSTRSYTSSMPPIHPSCRCSMGLGPKMNKPNAGGVVWQLDPETLERVA